MTNNDVLRRLRYTFNFNDKKMVALFALADVTVTREQVSQWLKKDDDDDFVSFHDSQLAVFLNGLINDKRGKKDGPQAIPEKRLTNNIILTKLKIALNLKAEDIINLLESVDFSLGKAELSAFFRKPDHKHYRLCKDQVLRNFLKGIEGKHFVARTAKFKTKTESSVAKADDSLSNSVDQSFANKNYQGARPKASKVYVNPNKKPAEKATPARKVLKLKPEDIWKQ